MFVLASSAQEIMVGKAKVELASAEILVAPKLP